jgi:hypothetical protein
MLLGARRADAAVDGQGVSALATSEGVGVVPCSALLQWLNKPTGTHVQCKADTTCHSAPPPYTQLRFSCNMVTQGFAWAASVARLWNSGLPRYMCLGRAVVPRLCSLTVGLTLDAARRYSFLHEVRRV